jgi:hypothetical protein
MPMFDLDNFTLFYFFQGVFYNKISQERVISDLDPIRKFGQLLLKVENQ